MAMHGPIRFNGAASVERVHLGGERIAQKPNTPSQQDRRSGGVRSIWASILTAALRRLAPERWRSMLNVYRHLPDALRKFDNNHARSARFAWRETKIAICGVAVYCAVGGAG